MTAYERRISDWSSDVCSSDLVAVSAIAPALAAGNAVVAKPSPVAPSSVLALARIAVERGLPPGILNAVAGGGDAGAALAGHGDVDQISFVGSASTGRRIMVAAGQSNGKPDRKSVVEGKSVSVRVDLGGRRVIEKKIIHDLINRHILKPYLRYYTQPL